MYVVPEVIWVFRVLKPTGFGTFVNCGSFNSPISMILARQTYWRFASLTPFTIVRPAGGDGDGNGDGNGRETKLLVLLVTFKLVGDFRALMVVGAIAA